MSSSFRSRLEEIADEHERVLARSRAISEENGRLRQKVAEALNGNHFHHTSEGTVVNLDEESAAETKFDGKFDGTTSFALSHVSEEWADKSARITFHSEDMSGGNHFPSEFSISNTMPLGPLTLEPVEESLEDPLPDTVPDENEYWISQIGQIGSQLQTAVVVSEGMLSTASGSKSLKIDAVPKFQSSEKDSPTNFNSEASPKPPRLPHRTSLQSAAVLSKWFNPDVEEHTFVDSCSLGTEGQEWLDRYRYMRLTTEAAKPDFCTIQPFGPFRLTWDLCAFICCLYELWFTPVELVYFDDLETPPGLKMVSHFIVVFFIVDIVLNFITGYVKGDETVMKRRAIAKHYMKFWLWVDIIATVPLDLIVETVTVDMFSVARVGKVSKVVKLLRYLKMVRAVRLVKTLGQAGYISKHFTLLGPLRALMEPVQVLVALTLLSHMHGCLWGACQPDWVQVPTVEEALKRYYESFWWAFIVLSAGIFNDASIESPWIWFLETIMASERLAFIVIAGRRVIRNNLAFIDEAREVVTQKALLSYFRRHNVSLKTQIQAMFSLTDVGAANKRQTHCNLLADLPHQLASMIRTEMWSDRLQSLGFIAEIATWNDAFITDLAQLLEEKVLPSKCVVFQYGSAAVCTYHIIDGVLQASAAGVPDFYPGMWIGENALVSSVLRYSATFITTTMASLMVVRGEDFRQLVSNLELMPQFERFCSDEVWRGLCGRCGSLGNHFSDRCPAIYGPAPDLSRRRSVVTAGQRQIMKQASEKSSKSTVAPGEDDRVKNREMSMMSAASLASGNSSVDSQRDSAHTQNSVTVGLAHKMRDMVLDRKLSRRSEVGLSSVETTDNGQITRALKRLLIENGLEHLTDSLHYMGVTDLDDLEQLDLQAFQRMLEADEEGLSSQQVRGLSPQGIQSFRENNAQKVREALFGGISRLQHLIFLSHYKVEAGTEAALIRTELEHLISTSPSHPGNLFDDAVFLDSDNLFNLTDLQEKVKDAHNLVLLLTKNVLRRRWVLLEILTAKKEGTRVVLVNISKPGCEFVFPNEEFYVRLKKGKVLDKSAMELLTESNFTLDDVEEALRSIFQLIALPYSPHKASGIRRAEMQSILDQCKLRSDVAHIQAPTVANSQAPIHGNRHSTMPSDRIKNSVNSV